jgi:hypothetical protein
MLGPGMRSPKTSPKTSIPPPPLVYLATGVALLIVLIVAVVDVFIAHGPSTLREILQGVTILVVLSAIGALVVAVEDRRRWISERSAEALELVTLGYGRGPSGASLERPLEKRLEEYEAMLRRAGAYSAAAEVAEARRRSGAGRYAGLARSPSRPREP